VTTNNQQPAESPEDARWEEFLRTHPHLDDRRPEYIGGAPSPPSEGVPAAPSRTLTKDSTGSDVVEWSKQQEVGEERLAEGGRLWRDLPSNLREILHQAVLGQVDPQIRQKMGAGTAADVGPPLGEVLGLVPFQAEAGGALAREGFQTLGQLARDPSSLPSDLQTDVQRLAGGPEVEGRRPFSQALGEHLQAPWYQRYPLEILADPLNVPVVGPVLKGIRSLPDLLSAVSRGTRGVGGPLVPTRGVGGPGVRVPPRALGPGQPGTVLPQGDPRATRVTLPREEVVPEVRPKKAPSEYSFVLVDTLHPRGRVLTYTNNDEYKAALDALSPRADLVILPGNASSVDVEKVLPSIQRLQPPRQRTTVQATRVSGGPEGARYVSPRPAQRQFQAAAKGDVPLGPEGIPSGRFAGEGPDIDVMLGAFNSIRSQIAKETRELRQLKGNAGATRRKRKRLTESIARLTGRADSLQKEMDRLGQTPVPEDVLTSGDISTPARIDVVPFGGPQPQRALGPGVVRGAGPIERRYGAVIPRSGMNMRGGPLVGEGWEVAGDVPRGVPFEGGSLQEAERLRAALKSEPPKYGVKPDAKEQVVVKQIIDDASGAIEDGAPPGIVSSANGPTVVLPSATERNILNLQPIQANLSKIARVRNFFRREAERVPGTPETIIETAEANGVIAERRRVRQAASSLGANLGTQVTTLLRRGGFVIDSEGRIPSLAGIDTTLPGAPTISDVASRLPRYLDSISSTEVEALERVQSLLAPWRKMQDDLGIPITDAVDVLEGGFYIPRGPVVGTRRVGTRRIKRITPGSQKERTYLSQAAGITNGDRYMPIGKTLQHYAIETSNQVNDNWTAKYLTAVGERVADEGPTGTVTLRYASGKSANISAPIDIANAINGELRREAAPSSTGALNWVLNGLNMWRNAKTTLDNSGPMIQGLFGLATNQKAWSRAIKANLEAAVSPDAQGRFLGAFDKRAGDLGTPTSQVWAGEGLHFGGTVTEFTSEALARLPLVGRANRMFSTFGDSMRLAWAEEELLGLMKQTKKSVEEFQQSGDLARIANQINHATGWSTGKAGASIGDFVLFAPRFFQARLEHLFDAAMSVPASARGLIPGQAGASLEQRIARKSFLRLIAYGTALTFAANYALRKDIYEEPYRGKNPLADFGWMPDVRPMRKIKVGTRDLKKPRKVGDWTIREGEVGLPTLSDPKIARTTKDKEEWRYNTNFMTIPFMGRDWSAFGTTAGTVAFVIAAAPGFEVEGVQIGGTGRPLHAITNVGNLPLSALGDFLTGKDFENDPLPFGIQGISDDPEAFIAWAGEQFAPIATSEGLDIGRDVVSGRYGAAAAKLVGDLQGIRSSKMTKSDKRKAAMKLMSRGKYDLYTQPESGLSYAERKELSGFKRLVDAYLEQQDSPSWPSYDFESYGHP
jgi:hypothetical protein